MPVTIAPFNHTARKFLSGECAAGDDYRVNLYTAFVFNAAATTKTGAEAAATQVANGNGYLQDSFQLQNVTVTTVLGNGAKFDADDAVWTASGGSITAGFAMIYNDDDPDDAPLFFIDFGGTASATDSATLSIVFSANGIFRILTP